MRHAGPGFLEALGNLPDRDVTGVEAIGWFCDARESFPENDGRNLSSTRRRLKGVPDQNLRRVGAARVRLPEIAHGAAIEGQVRLFLGHFLFRRLAFPAEILSLKVATFKGRRSLGEEAGNARQHQ